VSISRPACAVLGALLVTLSLAACGSSSSNTSANANAGATQPGGGARRGFLQDLKVVACLKKQGVTLASRPPGGNGGPPPSGQSPPNRPDSAQFQKLRAALQKCGVDFRGGPPNGQPPQDQGQDTPSTSAS
jgi:hypothetical protein